MSRSPLVSFMIGNAPFYSCLRTSVQKLLDLHNVVLHSISVIWSIRPFNFAYFKTRPPLRFMIL